jgi:hypothetical protein
MPLALRLRAFQLSLQGRFLSGFWREVLAEEIASSYILNRRHNPYTNLDCPEGDPKLRDSLRAWNREEGTDRFMQHNEYVLHVKHPVVLEPHDGWAILGPGRLLTESLPYHYFAQPPSLRARWISTGRMRLVTFPAVVSLRSGDNGNYFHCLFDVLTRLVLANRLNLPDDLPLVVSQRLYEKDFFQTVLRRTSLHRRNWIVQGPRQYVRAEAAYFIKTLPVDRECLDVVLKWLTPPQPRGRDRRLFVNRGPVAGRGLVNIQAVRTVMAKYDFEEVCLALFATARHVVGLHGAGLTNLLFRQGRPLALLEVFPPEIFKPFKAAPHYYWLCAKYGYNYDAIRGEPIGRAFDRVLGSSMSNFRLQPELLESRVQKLIEQ